MAMSASNSRGVQAEPNVTPLIDVLLVLLIIFMVVVPVTPRGLQALLPQRAKPGQPTPAETVIVEVLARPAGPMYTINRRRIGDRKELAEQLSRAYSLRAEKILFIRGDPALDFASVADVIDLSRAIGIDHVAILTPDSSVH